MHYAHPSEIMDEIARLTPTFAGVSFEKLDALGSVQWPCNDKAPEGTPIMHIGSFVRGKGNFVITEYVPTDEQDRTALPAAAHHRPHPQPVQCRRADAAHRERRLARGGPARDPSARRRGARHPRRRLGAGSQAAPARPRCARKITDRVAPGVVYTTFHHPDTQANVVTTDYSDWATNCPEYKVTAVQVSPSNGPSEWQEHYQRTAPPEPPHRRAGCRRGGMSGLCPLRRQCRRVARAAWRGGELAPASARSPKKPRSPSPTTASPMR